MSKAVFVASGNTSFPILVNVNKRFSAAKADSALNRVVFSRDSAKLVACSAVTPATLPVDFNTASNCAVCSSISIMPFIPSATANDKPAPKAPPTIAAPFKADAPKLPIMLDALLIPSCIPFVSAFIFIMRVPTSI